MPVTGGRKVKNIRVPSGKEGEYSKDVQGNIIHTEYGEDEDLDAVVLPSGKGADRFGTGGQHGVHIDPLDIPQNVVLFDESGMQVVTKTTGRELARTIPKGPQVRTSSGDSSELSAEEAERLGANAEATFRGLAAQKAAAIN